EIAWAVPLSIHYDSDHGLYFFRLPSVCVLFGKGGLRDGRRIRMADISAERLNDRLRIRSPLRLQLRNVIRSGIGEAVLYNHRRYAARLPVHEIIVLRTVARQRPREDPANVLPLPPDRLYDGAGKNTVGINGMNRLCPIPAPGINVI